MTNEVEREDRTPTWYRVLYAITPAVGIVCGAIVICITVQYDTPAGRFGVIAGAVLAVANVVAWLYRGTYGD